jgi:hypothetical protein
LRTGGNGPHWSLFIRKAILRSQATCARTKDEAAIMSPIQLVRISAHNTKVNPRDLLAGLFLRRASEIDVLHSGRLRTASSLATFTALLMWNYENSSLGTTQT